VPLILFDQNVPRALAPLLTGHTIRTAAEHGWEELTNGDLLKAANGWGFSVLVTADQKILHQQNMRARSVGLIVLSTNHWPTLRGNADRILQTTDRLEPAGYAYVACGLPPKRRRPVPRPKP
jgi:hypothetical protein